MKELYIEGLATHGGPGPCVGARKDDGEALAGVHAGQPLSREINTLERRRCHCKRKATLPAALCASRWRALRGQRP